MADLTIDRLTLKLSGMSDRDGRRLAQLVATDLAAAWGPNESIPHVESVRVSVAANASSGLDRLSEQIVADVLRQLRRSLVS